MSALACQCAQNCSDERNFADSGELWSHIPHCWKSHVMAQLYWPKDSGESHIFSGVIISYTFLVVQM